MVEEPTEEPEWWLDARTRAAAEKALNLSEFLTFTVYEARPLRLSRVQVRCRSCQNAKQQPCRPCLSWSLTLTTDDCCK